MQVCSFQSAGCSAVFAIIFGVLGPTMNSWAEESAELPKYRKILKPFFAHHCVRGHGSETSEGDMRLDTLAPAVSDP